nr:Gag-Pol polyprotein [Tanacetum cinerariifolium]
MSVNTKFAKQPIVENLPKIGKTNALSKPVTSNFVSTPQVSKGMNNAKVISQCMFRISPDKVSREAKKVPNTVSAKKVPNTCDTNKVSFKEIQMTYRPKVSKPKNVGTRESLATPKPRKPRFLFRWSPTSKMFDQDGKLVVPINSESHVDCSNGYPDLFVVRRLRNDLVAGLPKFMYHKEHLCPSCEQGKSKRASHPLKPVPNLRQRLHLLHMDLCGPMRIASINEKRKLDISFLHVFGALCYLKNDREDIRKLGELDLLFEAMYDDYFDGQPSASVETVPPVQEPQVRQTSTASTTIAYNVPIPTNLFSHATNIPITSQDVDELNPNAIVDGNT